MSNRSPRPPQKRQNPVTKRYQVSIKGRGKYLRFWALARLFKLSPNQVAKATGFSRPYVARLLSRKDDFTGSPEFFRSLELKLGAVVDGRTVQFFTVPATP